MKPSLVLPLATALAGFALGWLAKPAATDALTVPPLAAPPVSQSHGQASRRGGFAARQPSASHPNSC